MPGEKKTKRIRWEYDEAEQTISVDKDSVNAINESRFKFMLTRYKDTDTHEENLKIDCIYDEKPNGYIITNISNLETDLQGLKKYGVALSGIAYWGLQSKIESVYLDLIEIAPPEDPNAPKMVNDAIMGKILLMIGDSIKEFEFKDACYNVPVEEFKGMFEDSEYEDYDNLEIKKWLAQNGYIKCGIGRLSRIVRIKGKPTRVLSFYEKKVKSYIQEHDAEKELSIDENKNE